MMKPPRHRSIVIEIFSSDDESEKKKITECSNESFIEEKERYGNEVAMQRKNDTSSSSISSLVQRQKSNHNYYQPSREWQETIQRCIELNEKFVDDTFPPNSSSLDGRRIHHRHSMSDKILHDNNSLGNDTKNDIDKQTATNMVAPTSCRCGVPAKIKTVQRDGPNYGRFYLSCGRNKPRKRINKNKAIKQKDGDKDDGRRHDKEEKNQKDGTQIQQQEQHDVIIIIDDDDDDDDDHNSKEKEGNIDSNQSKGLTIVTNMINKPQCSFFKWDDNHEQTNFLSSSSRSAWVHNISWFRYEAKHGYNLTSPKGCFAPDHVKQGGMGDCWFLSALAVVAEKPYLIHQLLPHVEFNEFGCYEVRFCLDGTYSSVLVDSLLPSLPIQTKQSHHIPKRAKFNTSILDDNAPNLALDVAYRPVFASSNVSWPAIIEKAYAKVHGSYTRLNGGFISEALYDLTGAPIERIQFQTEFDYDELFARLLSFSSCGFPMGIATCQGGDGLVPYHAYSLLGVFEVHDVIEGSQGKMTHFFKQSKDTQQYAQRRTIRLVSIRNPWGSREWKGKWSKFSEQWTRKIKGQLGIKLGNGTFVMEYKDMVERFDHIDVAKCQENWTRKSMGGSVKMHETGDGLMSSPLIYFCKVQKKTWCYLSFVQKKKRANTTTQFWYTDISMVVLRREINNDLAWSRCHCILQGVQRSCDLEIFMDPLYEYLVVPFSYLSGSDEVVAGSSLVHNIKAASFRLTSYAANEVQLQVRQRKKIHCEAVLIESIHISLLTTEKKVTHSLGPSCVLVAIFKKNCIYFVVLNGGLGGLMLKLMIESNTEMMVGHGVNHDTHIIPPKSQSVILVLVGNGHRHSTQVHFKFQADSYPGLLKQKYTTNGIGAISSLSLAGDAICSNYGVNDKYNHGTGTLDERMWNMCF